MRLEPLPPNSLPPVVFDPFGAIPRALALPLFQEEVRKGVRYKSRWHWRLPGHRTVASYLEPFIRQDMGRVDHPPDGGDSVLKEPPREAPASTRPY